MRRLLIPLTLLLASPAAAQEPEWRQAREEQVLLRVSAIEPGVIRLQAGVPTRLVFFNSSRTALGVQAPGLFSRGRIRGGDLAAREGGFRLGPSESRTVEFVPTVGRYRIRSTSLFRRLVGMSALVIVEPGPAR